MPRSSSVVRATTSRLLMSQRRHALDAPTEKIPARTPATISPRQEALAH